jgi:hypothetical protein
VGVEPDHLIELAVGGMVAGQGFWKADAVPRVEVHGWKGEVGVERLGKKGWAGKRWKERWWKREGGVPRS